MDMLLPHSKDEAVREEGGAIGLPTHVQEGTRSRAMGAPSDSGCPHQAYLFSRK